MGAAGDALRARMDEALRRAGEDAGHRLVWTAHEAEALDAAARCADRRAELQAVYDELLAARDSLSVLTKLAAEIRACDMAAATHLARVAVTLPGVKSQRHVRAAAARWERERRAG